MCIRDRSGVSWAHSLGYVWFHDIFIPALEKVASLSLMSNEAICDAYYIAGDITEFNEAPNKAIEYYLKALSFDPYCGAAHREIANMLGRMGRFDEALEHSDKAIALEPDDVYALSDREGHLEGGPTLYEEGDVFWEVCEHLANAAPLKALALVEHMNDAIGLRGQLYCYGALDDPDKYLQTWSKLTQISESMDLVYSDWFFMPEYIYERPMIWGILLSSKSKFSGVSTMFDSLKDSRKHQALTTNEVMRLSFQYHEYMTSKNDEGLRRLFETYPEWTELKEYFS